MAQREFKSFEEFWPFYVSEHKGKTTRLFHFAGTTAAMGCLAGAVVFRKKWLVPAALVAGYGPAWISHFFIEKNKPASFKHPLWSLRADLVMWSKMVRGQMQAEVDRVVREEEEREREEEKRAAAETAEAASAVAEGSRPEAIN